MRPIHLLLALTLASPPVAAAQRHDAGPATSTSYTTCFTAACVRQHETATRSGAVRVRSSRFSRPRASTRPIRH